jgi:transcriptional regulator with XRE-family HTH domain
MRGAGDHLSIGERIAFYRVRRGYTQSILAGLVGRSGDWLSKIERGERDIRRLDILTSLAQALRVTLGDLLGQPVLAEDEHEHDDVPAIRDALMTPRRLSRVLYRQSAEPPGIEISRAAQLVEYAWADYQRGSLGRVVAALPGLIQTAQRLEDSAGGGSQAWALSARTHHLAATAMAKLGEADLAWIAAERSMQAADRSDDPLVLASAARAGTHALLSVGRYEDAMDLGMTAARWLRGRLTHDDPAALSLFGMLHLRTAVAAARHQDRTTASELLEQAGRAARQLGRDANYWQTSFGPTNVALHRISAALDLGDLAYVAGHGPAVNPAGLPAERRVTHHIDVARAQSLMAQDEAATQRLLTAESEAPHLVRQSAAVRETVRAMYRRSPGTSSLARLAERCRAIQ